MGLFFKKSKKFGLFRLNASKSGLGLSFGVKGCRIAVNSKGVQVNTGTKGVYYRKSVSWNKLKGEHPNTLQEEIPNEPKIIQIKITKEQEKFNNTFTRVILVMVIFWLFLALIRLWALAYFILFLGVLFNLKLSLSNPTLYKEMVNNSNKFLEYTRQGYCVEYKKVENEQKRLEKKYKDYNYSYKNYKK